LPLHPDFVSSLRAGRMGECFLLTAFVQQLYKTKRRVGFLDRVLGYNSEF